MKIASSAVHMAATTVSESRFSIRREAGAIITTQGALRRAGLESGRVEDLTDEQKEELQRAGEEAMNPDNQEALRQNQQFGFNRINRLNPIDSFLQRHNNHRMELLIRLLEAFTGRRIPIGELMGNSNMANAGQAAQDSLQAGLDNMPVILTFQHMRMEWFESEKVCFSATAHIVTEDGREFNIEMAVNMSRELYTKFEFAHLGVHEFIDPLVINFDAAFARLCDTKMTFDLDADGTADQISRLLSGSGYLAVYDGTGEVHDGSQLFGALCGNGFAHLARYDSDGNGWIDANDDIWNCLRLWVHNEDGTTSLIGLGEVGVGAIFLGNVHTDFTLAGETGDVNGAIRRTGIFLFEDGTAGTVQHLDLRV